MVNPDRLRSAYQKARGTLLAERRPEGYWVGELSASALATATAATALTLAASRQMPLVGNALQWLANHQNADGGWGDTVHSFSNISTTMLCRAAFHVAGVESKFSATLLRCETWLAEHGRNPLELAEAIRRRYGKDRTFSVPILMTCALAGLVPWKEVPRLPFELACLPPSWYRFARMPVVSYALPALIAIGQVIHLHRPTWNPLMGVLRWLAKNKSLRVLERIQPSSGGYLEAIPLTSFVVMSLAAIRAKERRTSSSGESPADRVLANGVAFLENSVLSDGSWAIDSNLSIWVTTLAINALAGAGDFESLDRREKLWQWLLQQQTKVVHPFTGASPGAWGWSHLPGSVPDCDDTPGAILALQHFLDVNHQLQSPIQNASQWVLDLQNRDGGWPTFCRGWGKLPFDRSGSDLTAHALRAVNDPSLKASERGFAYLQQQQRPDGSWLPLWFGNQHAPDDINPVYGTARVLAAYRDLNRADTEEARRGIAFLLDVQNADGGWGGAKATPSSVEETSLAVEVLIDLVTPEQRPALDRGLEYLILRVEDGSFTEPTPIGFYFAKLWYFENLYPIIFTVAALGRATTAILAGKSVTQLIRY